MAKRPDKSIAAKLTAANVAISNTQADPEISALVAAKGYTTEKMNEGKALYDAANAAVNAQTAAGGTQQDGTKKLNDAKKAAHVAYQDLAQIARAKFKKPQLVALGLTGREPRTTAAFITAGYSLFDNAQNIQEIRTVLATVGYDQAKLQSDRAKITAYDDLNRVQESAKGAAQQATQEQDAALLALNNWVAEYIKIARVALRGKEQLLEKIGVRARTTRTAAQRGDAKKAAATRAANKAQSKAE